MGSGCPAPCHVHIPVLSPLEGQGSCSSPGTGHCLQHPGTAVREFRHSLCWSWGWAASQRAQTLLGCCPCSEHTPAPALCSQSSGEDGRGSHIAWVVYSTLQKKIGAGPALSLPKKPHLGHQALPEAGTRHRQLHYSCLLCGRTGAGGSFSMCQRSWCRSGDGGHREAHLTT